MLVSRMTTGEPEIFASVQGEGVSTGVPSVFVRLAECHLRCSWCDTKYTWDWDHHDRTREVAEVTAETVIARALERAGTAVRNIVLTGGEPLLQQDDLAVIAHRLHDAGLRIEVETSGSITPIAALAPWIDQWNVSPKLANSGNARTARLRSEPMAWFAAAPDAYFKFVIVEPADVVEVGAIAAQYGLAPGRITLMPEATDATTLTERAGWLSALCLEHGFRLGTRLHVLLWGSERGR